MSWIQTFTGRRVDPLAMRVGDLDIKDIAHALAYKCRFNGHTTRHYSVAQHSVLVSQLVPREFALWGLLHDAAEAYLPDVAAPIKSKLAGFEEIEAAIMVLVAERFGLDPVREPPEVKAVDRCIVLDEGDALMGPRGTSGWWSHQTGHPLGVRITPWVARSAEQLFLLRFEKLGGLIPLTLQNAEISKCSPTAEGRKDGF